jgi:hypothetical protein
MTDFRALCAELVSELFGYKVANPMHDRSLVKRACAELGETRRTRASVEQVAQIVYENAMLATAPDHAKPHWPSWADLPNSDTRIHALNTAEIILARWGNSASPALEPIPVSERLPEDTDCLVITAYDGTSSFDEHYCYLAKEFRHCGRVLLIWELKPTSALKLDLPFTYWLPASTRFLPTAVDPAQPT